MKHIVKLPEPIELTDWKNKANEDWKPTYEDLRKPQKQIVHLSLIAEQGGICCYCERRISLTDSHIEHFDPQHRAEALALEYSNMICSCFRETEKGVPLHCGPLKDKWFDESGLVSPLDPTCEQEFVYFHDGTIKAKSGSSRGKTTIGKLGLDVPRLNAMREKAIEPFIDGTLEEKELQKFVDGYLKPTDGQFNAFHTTIKFLFAS